jgi:hypothetical protein
MQYLKLVAALTFGSGVQAHMALEWPLPFRASYNPNSLPANIDYSLTSPLNADGSNFPCKGYQVDLGTPAGASVVTWSPGGSYNYSVIGGATHGGGSCQAALSYDKGVSFTVIHSYIGSCPLSDGEAFPFTIPSDAQTGSALFAWTWYNEIGDREIYQDCASVTISGTSGAAPANTSSTAFADRPSLFVANLGNGCTTVEGKEVVYPDPGPDVTMKESVTDDSGSFTGTCQPVKGIGAGSSGSASNSSSPASSGSSDASSTVSVSTPTTMATSIYSVTIVPSSSANTPSPASASASSSVAAPSYVPSAAASAAASTGSSSGSSTGLTVTADGECSGANTCQGSIHGPCCSQWGWCGSTDAYCGTGCQAGFGQCGTFINSTAAATTSAAEASQTTAFARRWKA